MPTAPRPGILPTALAATAAMIAFAANSVLCRLALATDAIDPASFTAVRLASGAAALLVVAFATGRARRRGAGSWTSGALLFAYAMCFSLAYVELNVAAGALILFGAVQLTMMAAAIASGERPQPLQWLGLAAALGGLAYLVSPGLSAPAPAGAALMAASGAAWGLYTLRGRGDADPVSATTDNFVRAAPLALVAGAILLRGAHAAPRGLILAAVSGAVTSGIGYAIWYAALRGLTATRASAVQLTVPVIAALGGVLFTSETITPRLALASAAILGGVSLVLAGRETGRGTRRAAAEPETER